MKFTPRLCLFAFAVSVAALAQDQAAPMRQGVHVEMAVASHAKEMRAADENDATVVSITADGRTFVGIHPVDVAGLASLDAKVVYVKADARAAYQKVLTVLDALHGRSIVLLTAPTEKKSAKMMPPYGVKVTVGGQ